MHTLPIGTTLQDGKITIQSVLGSGGFGITYKAQHTFQGVIALKEMFISGQNRFCTRDDATHRVKPNAALAIDYAYFTKLFKDEADTLSKFRKVKGIVNVLDTFKENDTIYIVMQYVAGDSLKQLVTKRGTLPLHEVKTYGAQLCAALTEVHTADVIHRDIAPDNILITPEGKPVLIDFGIARTFIDGVTITHSAFIKPGFSAPEQEVERAQRGAYTDIYSLAATLFYCLTAERPASAAERGVMGYRSAHEYNPAIPPDLSAVLDKALSVKPIDRYQTAKQFADALGEGTVIDEEEEERKRKEAEERRAFNKIDRTIFPSDVSKMIPEYEDFIKKYPNSEYRKIVEQRLKEAEQKQKEEEEQKRQEEDKAAAAKNYKPLLAFLAAAVVGAGGYIAYNKAPNPMPQPVPIDSPKVVITPEKPPMTPSGAITKNDHDNQVSINNLKDYDRVWAESEGFRVVSKNGKWGWIKADGTSLIAPIYEECGSFHNGMAAVKKDGKWGFANTAGKLIIGYKYKSISAFGSKCPGLAQVNNGVKMVYIDKTGKEVGNCEDKKEEKIDEAAILGTYKVVSFAAYEDGKRVSDNDIIPYEFQILSVSNKYKLVTVSKIRGKKESVSFIETQRKSPLIFSVKNEADFSFRVVIEQLSAIEILLKIDTGEGLTFTYRLKK